MAIASSAARCASGCSANSRRVTRYATYFSRISANFSSRVVRLIGKAQSALHDVDEVAIGVSVVAVDVGAEKTGAADPLERAQEARQLMQIGNLGGAVKSGHMRITCPPIAHPCFMGVDMGPTTN